MSDRLDNLRTLSKRLYGRIHHLEIAEWIAAKEDGVVTINELHWELELAHSSVTKELGVMESVGLLERLPQQVSGDIPRRRAGSDSYWAAVREMCAAATEPVPQ